MKNTITLLVDDLTRCGFFLYPTKIKTQMLDVIRQHETIAEEHDKAIWNEAIETAAQSAEIEIWTLPVGEKVKTVNRQSILKLKK